jgi:DNA-binding CsgD family transcriptional regulator
MNTPPGNWKEKIMDGYMSGDLFAEHESDYEEHELSVAGRVSQLTERQREVARLLAKGLTNAEVAKRLLLSEHTVHEHVRHINEQLGCHRRSQSIALLVRAEIEGKLKGWHDRVMQCTANFTTLRLGLHHPIYARWRHR